MFLHAPRRTKKRPSTSAATVGRAGLPGRPRESDDEDMDEDESSAQVKALESQVRAQMKVSKRIREVPEDDEEEIVEDEASDEERALAELSSEPMAHRTIINDMVSLSKYAADLCLADFVESLVVVQGSAAQVKDVDDDLKREVVFHDNALAAVKIARAQLDARGVPHVRPTDFMATMVKSDEHMARIKQKLLLEERKISAAEQRVASQRFKHRRKEARKEKKESTPKRSLLGGASEYKGKDDAKQVRDAAMGDGPAVSPKAPSSGKTTVIKRGGGTFRGAGRGGSNRSSASGDRGGNRGISDSFRGRGQSPQRGRGGRGRGDRDRGGRGRGGGSSSAGGRGGSDRGRGRGGFSGRGGDRGGEKRAGKWARQASHKR